MSRTDDAGQGGLDVVDFAREKGKMAERYALPLTFVFVREGKVWASLACEVHVASCGDSLDHAREMAKDAVGTYVSFLVEEGRGNELARPTTAEQLAEFMDAPPEDLVIEYHTLLVTVEPEPEPKVVSLDFLPSAVAPACCHRPVAA